ncbi:MAG TPA: TMEM175 family protein [Methanobacterium sp.]|nr:TMEM175 family protein [Methanobacterium sp.]
MDNEHNEFNINKEQLQSFSNNVFAVAITLLVLNFTVPALQESNKVLIDFLMGLWPQFLGYTISFFIIASFFLNLHGYLKNIKYVNTQIFWTTMLQFFFIVLIPFSTLVMTEYGQLQIANVFFDINILIIGLLFYINRYMWTDGLINDNSRENYKKWRDLLIPLCAAIAILISFISPHHSQYAFLILFIPLLIKSKA